MPQEQFAQRNKSYRTFEQKSDTTLWISLGVGLALIGALAVADWASDASAASAAAESSASVQTRKPSVDPVYRCADGRVSFTPCG